jgi:hypothetical protein
VQEDARSTLCVSKRGILTLMRRVASVGSLIDEDMREEDEHWIWRDRELRYALYLFFHPFKM